MIFLWVAGYENTFCQTGKVFEITSYGARPGDNVLNTAAIQQAIDEATAAGGGTVMVPAGKFVTGSIALKSGVNLHLEAGAVLAGSVYRTDYNNYKKPALIIAVDQHDCSITGSGIIDGRGRELMKDIFKQLEAGTLSDPNWQRARPGEGTRTNLTYFEGCSHLTIKGVTLKDATSWVTHYERCDHLLIDSVRIESVAYWNNDGIDIVDCKQVRISHSFINAADDAICLKSAGRNDYCDSVWVEDCTLRSSANAFKLGTGSFGGFKNIWVHHLTVYDTYRSAIALEAVDGGFLENIEVRDVRATNTGSAILVRLGHRNNDEVYSRVKNIFIDSINVEVPAGKPDAGYEMEGPLLMYPPGLQPGNGITRSVSPWNYKEKMTGARIYRHNVFPSSITGLPGHQVEEVTIQNVEVNYRSVADTNVNYFPLDSFDAVTEAEKDYPEFSMFGEVPAWAFYVRHVKGLTMKNIVVKMKGRDYRPAFLFNDVKQLDLKNIEAAGMFGKPALFFNNVSRVAGSE